MNNVKYNLYIGKTDKSKPFIESLINELTIQCGGVTVYDTIGTFKEDGTENIYRDNTSVIECIAPYWAETRILELIKQCENDNKSGELCVAFTKQPIEFDLIYL